MNFVWYKGNFFDANLPVLLAANRGFKYGDGVFETMRLLDGKILLKNYHYDRLVTSLKLLQIQYSDDFKEQVFNNILELCGKNNCISAARIRLAAFRGADNKTEYLIEATPLTNSFYQWNEEGWEIDIYPDARKSYDAFSNLKSANYLPYVLADLYAKQSFFKECLVLNTRNFIADGSKTNIFIVKDKDVYTPALTEGCVDGVMRRFIIDELNKIGNIVKQTEIDIDLLLSADEVFLTNAIQGMQWAKKFRTKIYTHEIVRQIFNSVFSPIVL